MVHTAFGINKKNLLKNIGQLMNDQVIKTGASGVRETCDMYT